MFKASKTIYLPQFTGRFLQNRTEITLFNCFILLGFEIKSAVQLVKCYSVQFSSVLVVAVQEKRIIDTCCTKRGTSVLQSTSRHTESTFRLEHTESSVQELCSVFSIHLKWKNTVTIVHDHFFIQVGIQLIHMIRSSTSSHWLNFTHGPDTAAHSVAVMVISGTGMQTGSVLDWEACPTRSRHFGIFCLCPHL